MGKFLVVYRVEHPYDNIGPYQTMHPGWRCSDDRARMALAHSRVSSHPTPHEMVIYNVYDHMCGINTKPAFRQWFKGFFKVFEDFGFVVNVYKTKEYKEGDINHPSKQVVIPRQLKPFKTMQPKDFI